MNTLGKVEKKLSGLEEEMRGVRKWEKEISVFAVFTTFLLRVTLLLFAALERHDLIFSILLYWADMFLFGFFVGESLKILNLKY